MIQSNIQKAASCSHMRIIKEEKLSKKDMKKAADAVKSPKCAILSKISELKPPYFIPASLHLSEVKRLWSQMLLIYADLRLSRTTVRGDGQTEHTD